MNSISTALQLLPLGVQKDEAYDIIDQAIQVIIASGLEYKVCPYETVIEGSYEKIMQTVNDVRQVALNAGAEDMLIYLKIQIRKNQDVTIADKMGKYS